MLTAERASVYENDRKQLEYGVKLQSSLIQAATTPYGCSPDDKSNVEHSHVFKTVTDNYRHNEQVKFKVKTKQKHVGIQQFEIIFDKRTKSDELEKALGSFRQASLESLRKGVKNPPIKDYIDLETESFEPGEIVSGYVLLILSQDLPVNSLLTKLKGTYIVAYENKIEGESVTRTEQLTFLEADADVSISEHSNSLLIPGIYKCNDRVKGLLSPGVYKFTFKFKLPLNIPGTMFFERFQSVYEGASVVYSVEAKIDLEANQDQVGHSIVAKEIMSVVRKVPQKLEIMYHQKFNVNKVNEVSFCCYTLGNISVKVSLPRIIYMEGEVVVIELNLSNNSKLKIQDIVVALIQHSTFKNRSQNANVLHIKTILLSHTVPMNELGYGEADNQLALTLPDEMILSTMTNLVPPSCQLKIQDQHCSDADDQLENQINVKVRTASEWFSMKGPEINFPITIGGANRGYQQKRDILAEENLGGMTADHSEVDIIVTTDGNEK